MADTEKDQNILHKKARIIFNEVTRMKRGADVRNVYHCEGWIEFGFGFGSQFWLKN